MRRGMRFDGHRYVDCRWCRGGGCLQCEAEAAKAYGRAFPEGPKPLATFRLDNPADVERARRLIGPEAIALAIVHRVLLPFFVRFASR